MLGACLRHQVEYTAIRLAGWVGGRLPLRLSRPMGAALGTTLMALSGRSRKRCLRHFEIAFPELDEPGRRALLRATARHVGTMLAELLWLWRATPDDVADLCDLSGDEHLRDALSMGRGAVLITGHCGNWELFNARMCVAGLPMTIAVRVADDPRVDGLLTAMRARFGSEVVPRGPRAGRKLYQALLKNRVAGFLIDQDIRDVPTVFVPYFGKPASTPLGAATLALRAGCPVIPGFIHRRDDGRHVGEIGPPIPHPEHGSFDERVVALTAAATERIERQIRSYPEQWVWTHRRWRRRPPGEEKPS
jgi:KDO2-lipid IV(A) lauroyltransferase